MKQKTLLFIALTLLTFLMLTRAVRAQSGIGIETGIANPLRGVLDSVPGIRPGMQLKVKYNYNFGPRMSMNLTTGYVTLNTGHGFEDLAQQNGFTRERGFIVSAHSGGMINVALSVGYNILPIGASDCGQPKPSLIIGAGAGVSMTTGEINGVVLNKAGETAFAVQQTDKPTTPYYLLRAELLYPLNNRISIVTGAAWDQGLCDLSVMHSSNGAATVSHYKYSDLQISIGVQVAFKGIQEKGIKRNASIAVPAVEDGGTSDGSDSVGAPQGRPGQPIGGIVVKGGQNPGSKPKPHAMVAGSPIGGIVVKGGQNPGSKPKPHAMVEGNPIPGVVIKGGINALSTVTTLTYKEDMKIDDAVLLDYLGTSELMIAKGEYTFDHSVAGETRVMVHLKSKGIVHRDLAARSFSFDGTDPDGGAFTYTIEPLFVEGVAKDILITYKGISEKGIK